MSAKSYEAGLRPARVEFLRETETGTTDDNPDWEAYSDTIRSIEPGPSVSHEAQRGLSDAFPNDHFTGAESHELTIVYSLQQWFEDGSGDPLDAAYDGIQRDDDNRLPNSHTLVRRIEQTGIDASNTVSGSNSYDTRQYLVGKGGRVGSVTITGDSTSALPIPIELSYQFEKLRSYQIDQPDSATELVASSSDNNDDSQTLTIENEGAGTTDTIDLNGTSVESTTETFSDIDAVELDAETDGDITLAINDGTESSPSEGDALMVISGADSHEGAEGDLGVPALGTGSHAGELGTDYELVHGDTFERPSGTDLADEINTVEITVENDLAQTERASSRRPAIAGQGATPQATGTVFGETESFDKLLDLLTNTANDLVWTFDGGTLTIDNAVPTELGSTEEAEQGIKEVEVTFEGTGVTIA